MFSATFSNGKRMALVAFDGHADGYGIYELQNMCLSDFPEPIEILLRLRESKE